ncbi:MAG: sugar phosphate isomerase/epimerase [Ginsengibacter sp.]
MLYKRRNFIKTTAAGLAITAVSGNLWSCRSTAGLHGKNSLGDFGLQLYTLRDVIGSNPKGVLKLVADMGYKQIEGYEDSKQGIYWGMTNTEFKKYLDSIGLTMISTHCNIDKDFERKASEAAAIGMKYLLSPYVGRQKSLDDYKKIADKFNNRGEICKKEGIKFGYHNHEYSFKEQEGQFPQDIFMQNTNKDLVDFEMDIYWVVTAGQEPIAWLTKYPDRFTLCHIKDRKKDTPLSVRDASVNVGEGSIDFKKILKAAKDNSVKYFIVEQENYENTTPVLAAKADADYLKAFRF